MKKLDIYITLKRKNGQYEGLAHLKNIHQIRDFMINKIGVQINQERLITPKILEEIKNILEKAIIEYDRSQDFIRYRQYSDSLDLILNAINIINHTREIGDTIYYSHAEKDLAISLSPIN